MPREKITRQGNVLYPIFSTTAVMPGETDHVPTSGNQLSSPVRAEKDPVSEDLSQDNRPAPTEWR